MEGTGVTTVTRIEHPVDGYEGANSTYLLPESGIVIDPGPPGATHRERLGEGIETAGLALEEIDHVLVTHYHADHSGQAIELADRANATIHMHESDAPYVAEYEAFRAERIDRDRTMLRRSGTPHDVIESVFDIDVALSMPETYPVVSHSDGDEFGPVTVHATPGHTLGHAAYEIGGHLFVGDTVLPQYTPNIGGGDTRLEDPLKIYLDTLLHIDAASWSESGYPGHGSGVTLGSRINEIRAHHADRRQAVRDVVARLESATPWQVATRLFGPLEGIHAKMGVGEAKAHLVRLHAEGHLVEAETQPVRYRPT